MQREVHEHVVSELRQGAKTDTVFVITAVLFNLIVLGINWGVAVTAPGGDRRPENDWILGVLVIVTLFINAFAGRALIAGRQTRRTLITGLVAMYQDNGVAKYYDVSLLDLYATRYRLFLSVLATLAAVSIVVPLFARLMG